MSRLAFFLFAVSLAVCFSIKDVNLPIVKPYVEIGNHYCGIELHNGNPSMQRISWYYPVGNSVDNLTDYWTRDKTHIQSMFLALSADPDHIMSIGDLEFSVADWKPYKVDYWKTIQFNPVDANEISLNISVQYRFFDTKPGFAQIVEINNPSREGLLFSLKSCNSLRTSHDYFTVDPTSSRVDGGSVTNEYNKKSTKHAETFVFSVGDTPNSVSLLDPPKPRPKDISCPAAGPADTLKVVQIYGCVGIGEALETMSYLEANWEKEVQDYEERIERETSGKRIIQTPFEDLDRSVEWAHQIMQVNQHHMDGVIVPMPTPAEYNFFFSHDTLQADMVGVIFDYARIERDLRFIADHSYKDDDAIMHAFYWMENDWNIEECEPTNWNHMWWNINMGRFLRHYPSQGGLIQNEFLKYINGSINRIIANVQDDDLIWNMMPDWWDIGNSHAARTYPTILSIRAIREYISLASSLGISEHSHLCNLESLANRLEKVLQEKLWDPKKGFLMNNYNSQMVPDPHLYIGTLAAPHFIHLNATIQSSLMNTAKETLLDEKIGIYNAHPFDFLDPEVEVLLQLGGDLACQQGLYFNGGIWNHGNAWYVLGLMEENNYPAALKFLRQVMSLEGIWEYAGQPAMYEYRDSLDKDPLSKYGRVDKPQFLWAASWTIYSIYNYYGYRETEWNIGFRSDYWSTIDLPVVMQVNFRDEAREVKISGKGEYITSISDSNGNEWSSTIVPQKSPSVGHELSIKIGNELTRPMLTKIDSLLTSCSYDEQTRSLEIIADAFEGHRGSLEIMSPWPAVRLDSHLKGSVQVITLDYVHTSKTFVKVINFQ